MFFVRRLVPFIVFLSLTSCSQYNHGFLSKGWHNLNSKFNALLIAREDISVAKEYIALNYKENYDDILPVYRIIDSTTLDTAKLYLIDAIKKSSIIAEKHSNSKHLDEAYLQIGEARILKGEFENAIETYKYLNTTSNSESAKTEALTQMMRAYIELKDFQNAEQLTNVLKSRQLDKKNRQVYLMNMAYFHQKMGENAVVAVLLEDAVKSMRKGEEKARVHFILGQLYDQLGQVTLARKNYRSVIKNKPDYDLVFNADLGLLMNESLARNTNIAFEKMLDNRKNQDLKHKIYYKMGETARKKRQPEKAIEYFSTAVRESGSDLLGKGFAYKAIGDVYLDDFIDYENAAKYYDSTVITVPKEHLRQSDIGERAMYLNEFIRYKKVYDLEDSLQRMAALSPEALDYALEKTITAKRDAEKLLLEEQAKQVAASQLAAQPSVNTSSSKKWRLYDPQQLVKENNDFVRIWGNRKLEDDWRRTEKSSTSFVFNESERRMEEKLIVPTDSINRLASQAAVAVNNPEQERRIVEEEIKEFKKRLPTTKIQMIASKRKQEEAMFRIAKIYKLKFKDDKKANETFRKFLEDYPKSTYEPEVLYYLALAEENPLESSFAKRLLNEYPNTSFGRQIRKGVVVMTKDREGQAVEHYSKAFNLYNDGKFDETVGFLEDGLNDYVGSQVEDKMALLRIYALAKVGTRDQYMISLTDFIRSYPSSDLVPKAKEMLAVLN